MKRVRAKRNHDSNFEMLSDLSLSTLGLFAIVFVVYSLIFNSRNMNQVNKAAQMNETIDTLKYRNSNLIAERNAARAERNAARAERNAARQQKKQAEEQLNNARQRVEETEEQLRQRNQDLDTVKAQNSNLIAERDAARAERNAARQQKKQAEEQLNNARQRVEKTEEQLQKVRQGNQDLDTVKAQNSNLIAERDAARAERNAAWRQVNQVKEQLNNARQQVEETEDKLKKALQRNQYTGYYTGQGQSRLYEGSNCTGNYIAVKTTYSLFFVQDSNFAILTTKSNKGTTNFRYSGTLSGNKFTVSNTEFLGSERVQPCNNGSNDFMEFYKDYLMWGDTRLNRVE